MIVTEFIRTPYLFDSTENAEKALVANGHAVRVTALDGAGCHLEEPLPEGQVLVFDVLTHEEVTVIENTIIGYEDEDVYSEDGLLLYTRQTPIVRSEEVIRTVEQAVAYAVSTTVE